MNDSGGDYCIDHRGRAVRLKQVMEQYDIKPGCHVLMMDEAMIVGKCSNCKHFVPGEPICNGLAETNSRCSNHMMTNGAMTHIEALYVDSDFGCVMWEGK